jgi:hypothetical protein
VPDSLLPAFSAVRALTSEQPDSAGSLTHRRVFLTVQVTGQVQDQDQDQDQDQETPRLPVRSA